MHKAVRRGQLDVVSKLMRAGADRHITNNVGYDSVTLSINHNRWEIFYVILHYNLQQVIQIERQAVFYDEPGWN